MWNRTSSESGAGTWAPAADDSSNPVPNHSCHRPRRLHISRPEKHRHRHRHQGESSVTGHLWSSAGVALHRTSLSGGRAKTSPAVRLISFTDLLPRGPVKSGFTLYAQLIKTSEPDAGVIYSTDHVIIFPTPPVSVKCKHVISMHVLQHCLHHRHLQPWPPQSNASAVSVTDDAHNTHTHTDADSHSFIHNERFCSSNQRTRLKLQYRDVVGHVSFSASVGARVEGLLEERKPGSKVKYPSPVQVMFVSLRTTSLATI